MISFHGFNLYTDSILLIKEYAITQRLCGLFMSVETLLVELNLRGQDLSQK